MPDFTLVTKELLENSQKPYFNSENLVSGTVTIDKKEGENKYELNYNADASLEYYDEDKVNQSASLSAPNVTISGNIGGNSISPAFSTVTGTTYFTLTGADDNSSTYKSLDFTGSVITSIKNAAKKQFVNLVKSNDAWPMLENEGVYWLEKTTAECDLNGIMMEADSTRVLTAELHVNYKHAKPVAEGDPSDIVWPSNWQWVDESDKTKPTIPDEAYDATGAHVLCVTVRTVKGSTIANVSHVYQIPVSE